MFYLIIAAVVLLLIVIGLLVRAQVLIDVFTKSNEKRAGLSNKINGLLQANEQKSHFANRSNFINLFF